MLELKCIGSRLNDKTQQYCADLVDFKNNEYQFILNDLIPKTKIIRLNPFYHEFETTDNYTRIKVKQKFNSNNHPDLLELEVIDIYDLTNGTILSLRDTNTLDIYKMKINTFSKKVGNVEVLNLQDLNMIIRSMPHYYESYIIENWIFFNNVIDTL